MHASDMSLVPTPEWKHQGTVFSLALSADERTLASGSADQTVRLWDWQQGTSLNLGLDERPVWWVSISPNGRYLASASLSGQIRLWDLRAVNRFMRASPKNLVQEAEGRSALTLMNGQVAPRRD